MKSLTDDLHIESRATSSWEHGNPIHQGTQAIFKKHAISYDKGKVLSRFQRKILQNLIISSAWMKPIFEI